MSPLVEVVANGNLLLAIPIALLAGLLSFASPCVLPLVPGYLGFVGGFAAGGRGDGAADRGPAGGSTGSGVLGQGGAAATAVLSPETRRVLLSREKRRLLLGVALFVLGFSLVFVLFSLVFSFAGLLLIRWTDLITRVVGVIVIVMGLVFVGQFTFLQRTIRPRLTVATGLGGAPLLGIAFGLGWTPCIGPTLAVVIGMSVGGGSPVRGAVLGAAYCLGLGIPFLLVALGFSWVTGSVTWLRRHIRQVNIAGGAMLVVVGLLMATGVWQILLSRLGSVIAGFVPAL
jgi:cytochrome c-type biogenesis protein